MVVPPVAIPAPPTPEMARPTIRAMGFGATPQIRLPSSNRKSVTRKVNFKGKYLYALPQDDWKPPRHIKYADPYHETSESPWNSSVIFGMAVPTMVYPMLEASKYDWKGASETRLVQSDQED